MLSCSWRHLSSPRRAESLLQPYTTSQLGCAHSDSPFSLPQSLTKVQSSKFTQGVGSKASPKPAWKRSLEGFLRFSLSQVGMQMKGLVLANLHLFKKAAAVSREAAKANAVSLSVQEQQKSLQNGRRADKNSTANKCKVHTGTPLQPTADVDDV